MHRGHSPNQPVDAYIGLGSNLGDREAHVNAGLAALASLPQTTLTAASRVIQTQPVVPDGAALSSGGGAYLNAVARLRTALSPRGLLDRLLAAERSRGRERHADQRWGPRTLDLDLLLYGDLVIDEPGLTIPHPRLHERAFVLAPLAELAPDLPVPPLGLTIAQLLHAVSTESTVRG